jgi:hypothetical protein
MDGTAGVRRRRRAGHQPLARGQGMQAYTGPRANGSDWPSRLRRRGHARQVVLGADVARQQCRAGASGGTTRQNRENGVAQRAQVDEERQERENAARLWKGYPGPCTRHGQSPERSFGAKRSDRSMGVMATWGRASVWRQIASY